jgi:hypothetical protein
MVCVLCVYRSVDVHVTPTRNLGQIMSTMMKEVHVGGKSNFLAALKTAQLVLKNRQNKNQRQRIIMFVGSPVCELWVAAQGTRGSPLGAVSRSSAKSMSS